MRDIPAVFNNLEYGTLPSGNPDPCLRLHDLSRSGQSRLLDTDRSIRSRGSGRRRRTGEC